MTALLHAHSGDSVCSDTWEPRASADAAAPSWAAQQEQLLRVASELLPALHKAHPAAAALLRAQLLAAVLQAPVAGLPAGPPTPGGSDQPSGGGRSAAALLAAGVRHIEASLPPLDVADLRQARAFLAAFFP